MSSSSIRSLCQIALFAAIIAVCSQIQIPLTVPFTKAVERFSNMC